MKIMPLAAILGALLVVGCVHREQASNATNEPNPAIQNSPIPETPPMPEDVVGALLQTCKASCDEKRYEDALDLLRASMVLEPHNPAVTDALVEFIESARSDPAGVEFAYMGVDQLEALIPYQLRDRIKPTRALVRDYRQQLEGIGAEESVLPSVPAALQAEIRRVTSTEADAIVKLRALQSLRAEVEGYQVQCLRDGSLQALSAELQQLLDDLGAADLAALTQAYQATRAGFVSWVNEQVRPVIREANDAETINARIAVESKIVPIIDRGRRLALEIAPYSEAGVEHAGASLPDIYDRLTRLERAREMNYNLLALARIRDVAARGADEAANKLELCRSLLKEVDERRLSPYIQERHRSVYEGLFNQLNEQEKVDITVVRILGELAD